MNARWQVAVSSRHNRDPHLMLPGVARSSKLPCYRSDFVLFLLGFSCAHQSDHGRSMHIYARSLFRKNIQVDCITRISFLRANEHAFHFSYVDGALACVAPENWSLSIKRCMHCLKQIHACRLSVIANGWPGISHSGCIVQNLVCFVRAEELGCY